MRLERAAERVAANTPRVMRGAKMLMYYSTQKEKHKQNKLPSTYYYLPCAKVVRTTSYSSKCELSSSALILCSQLHFHLVEFERALDFDPMHDLKLQWEQVVY